MNLRPFLAIALMMTAAFSTAKAQESAQEGLVEVRSLDQAYASYRDRRGTHGFLFGVKYENYYPDAFVSKIDEETYVDMFGNTPIAMMGIELGYKFNFFLGALAASYEYAFGKISDSRIGEERLLDLQRNQIKFTYIMDRLFEEPYGAPYVSLGIWDLGIDENISETDFTYSGKTQMGNSIAVGVLVQLNWLDTASARSAYMSTGLENTYLDLFMVQHSNTNSEDDPTTRSTFDWGAGLRLEF